MTEFLSGLADTLAEKGVVLSVLAAEQDVTAGGDSGLTAGAMAALGRVWLTGSADPSACAAALTDAGMENARSRLVLTAGTGGLVRQPGRTERRITDTTRERMTQ